MHFRLARDLAYVPVPSIYLETGLRGIREVQAADASQADDVSGHIFRVEGRVSEMCGSLKAEQTARTSVEAG